MEIEMIKEIPDEVIEQVKQKYKDFTFRKVTKIKTTCGLTVYLAKAGFKPNEIVVVGYEDKRVVIESIDRYKR